MQRMTYKDYGILIQRIATNPEIPDRLKSGLSTKQLASELGAPVSAVTSALDSLGMERRRRKPKVARIEASATTGDNTGQLHALQSQCENLEALVNARHVQYNDRGNRHDGQLGSLKAQVRALQDFRRDIIAVLVRNSKRNGVDYTELTKWITS